ncbi:zinc finger domain-containing protein [Marinobacter sp. CHS3-4]|uniref:zinc finger domain-containing protein n=1 Tax=Marinobacter sp. CHS3-4 TaxID=3045174 RepID=UPI0024B5C711|nr:zinc finger domain-containing protein [Marinobacter sp. CHS3-4]MDI9246394.1 zinc finger domain-containing protein [Marinobacter sp. CHS3-4]
MPEGPEIRRMVDDIEIAIGGQRAEQVFFAFDRYKAFESELAERLKQAGWTFGQRRHRVFNREGQACHLCDSPIQKIRVASRRLYFCPCCQNAG